MLAVHEKGRYTVRMKAKQAVGHSSLTKQGNSPAVRIANFITKVEKEFDYAACAPFILPAGTDARHFSNLSDVVVRFAPIDINNQQYGSVHNMDENIGTDVVVRAVKFYREVHRKRGRYLCITLY